jgi:hypothetical protein
MGGSHLPHFLFITYSNKKIIEELLGTCACYSLTYIEPPQAKMQSYSARNTQFCPPNLTSILQDEGSKAYIDCNFTSSFYTCQSHCSPRSNEFQQFGTFTYYGRTCIFLFPGNFTIKALILSFPASYREGFALNLRSFFTDGNVLDTVFPFAYNACYLNIFTYPHNGYQMVCWL